MAAGHNGQADAAGYVSALTCVIDCDYICFFVAIQDLLTNPNPKSPAQREAYEIFTRSPSEYSKRVKAQALKCTPTEDDV